MSVPAARSPLAPIARVLAAAMLFGTTGTVLAHAPEAATALSVGAVRLAIGGPLLLVVARWSGATAAGTRSWGRSILAGGVGVVAFQLLYFVATTRTGVALGTVVTIGSGPAFSGLIDWARSRRAPSWGWTAGTACSVVGVAMLAATGDAASVDAAGIVAALGAGLGWASFATISKWQIERGLDSTLSLGTMFTAAAVLCLPLWFTEPAGWLGSARGVVVAVYLGALTLTVAYTLYGHALRRLAAPTVITLTLLEPATAAVLAAVVLHETISAAGWAGIALVLLGLVVTARGATVGGDAAHADPDHRSHPRQHPGGAATDPAGRPRR